ncbi:MAG: diaminopimelate decarboxylase [Candidatus Nanopelagicales bacterium]
MPAHPAGPRHSDVIDPHGAPARPVDVDEMSALAPGIWPQNARRGTDGLMELGGLAVTQIVAEAGSPVVVLDEGQVRAAARGYVDAYAATGATTDVYYAGKAFLATAVARWLEAEGVRLDVCTGGELEIAVRAGVPGSHILFHGNNKSEAEISRALEVGVGRFVIDSFAEIARLGMLADEAGVVAECLVRVTVGVEAHTHEFIATAHEDQKFGLALADGVADEAVRRVAALPSLRLRGLHSHIGSQIFDPAGFEVAARRLVAFAAELAADGIATEELNLGGGMGIAYTTADDPLDVAEMASALVGIVRRECEQAGLPLPILSVEPGRAIVGPAGVTLYTVGTIKTVDLGHGSMRTFVSVDGGMSDNIRTALYDADYTVTVANRTSDAKPMLSRVVGKHCESGDIVVRDCWLPADLAPGDLLAVAATGAYCRSMASNYNQVPRPAVMSVADGHLTTVLRRETLDDLLALDPGA